MVCTSPPRGPTVSKRGLAWLALGCVVLVVAAAIKTLSPRPAAQCTDRAAVIAATCTAASANITGTVAALDTEPALGMTLAARDAALVPLCGGDEAGVRRALGGGAAPTRAMLLDLRRLWCPSCGR